MIYKCERCSFEVEDNQEAIVEHVTKYCSGPKKPEGGVKHDSGKPDLSMISWELMEGLARVRMFGEKKYARDNWKKGFLISRSCAAALRHIFQFLSGQTNDSESGLCHLYHAVAALEHAIYDLRHHKENDDRWVKDE